MDTIRGHLFSYPGTSIAGYWTGVAKTKFKNSRVSNFFVCLLKLSLQYVKGGLMNKGIGRRLMLIYAYPTYLSF